MSFLDRQQEGIEMWAILHVPSGAWWHGDTAHTFYYAKWSAREHCPNEAFKPVKVIVREGAQP